MPNKKINELSPRTPSLNDLMIVGDPSTGYSYKATINALTTFVGNNIQFSTLGGISLTNPSNGQVLQFDGTNWVNGTISVPVTSVFGRTGAVVAAEGDYSLTQLSDVTLTTPTTNQVLQYNGSGWVNGTISVPVTSVFGRTGNVVATEGDYTLTQLGDVTLTTPSTNQVLQYNGTTWVNATLTDNGITSLNGLTALTQTFATGTSGTDFAIVSSTSTHTFNLPTASATNRGALSSADWSTFNAKQDTIILTTTGSSGSATLVGSTLNIPTYTLSGLGGVSGSGTTNYLSKWTSSSALGNSLVFDNGTNVGIGTTSPSTLLEVKSSNGDAWVRMTRGNNGNHAGFLISPIGTWSNSNLLYNVGLFAGTNNLVFWSYNGTANNTFFTSFGATSNVWIGSTSGVPTDAGYRLDVSGTFRSTGDANINGLTLGKGGGQILTNTAIGYEAILNSTTGAINNVAQGYQALRTNTTGNNNSALGYVALYTNSVGIRNTAVGSFALQGLNSDNNTGIGFQNLLDVTSGQGNTAIGSNTGRGITTGSYNTIIGAGVTGLSSSLSNTIILADGQGNQRLYINSSGNVGIGTTSPSTLLHIQKDQNSTTAFTLQNSTNGTGSNIKIELLTNGGGTGVIQKYSPTTSSYKMLSALDFILYNSPVGGDISMLNDNTTGRIKFAAGGSSTSQMTLTAAGRLLIGTTTESTYLLDVNGTARISGALTMAGGGTLSAALTVGGGGYFIGNSSNGFRFNNNTDVSTLFYVDNGGTCVVGGQSFNTSAIFQVNSTTKGFLPPRMTNAQMVAIATPAAGLVVYDTTNNKLNVYDGTNWVAVH